MILKGLNDFNISLCIFVTYQHIYKLSYAVNKKNFANKTPERGQKLSSIITKMMEFKVEGS